MKCPKCRCENRPNNLFCIQCGTPLSLNSIGDDNQEKICPQCNRRYPSMQKFCTTCGSPLTRVSSPKFFLNRSWLSSFGIKRSFFIGGFILCFGGSMLWLFSSHPKEENPRSAQIEDSIAINTNKKELEEIKNGQETNSSVSDKDLKDSHFNALFTRNPDIEPDFLRGSRVSAIKSAQLALEGKDIFIPEETIAQKLIQDELNTIEFHDLANLINSFLYKEGYTNYFSTKTYNWGTSSLIGSSEYNNLLYQLEESLDNRNYSIVMIDSTPDGESLGTTYATIVDKKIVEGLNVYTIIIPTAQGNREYRVGWDSLRTMISIDGKAGYIFFPTTIESLD